MFKLFLDPGHGGRDSGYVNGTLVESELVYDLALEIRNIFLDEYVEIQIYLSRSKDESPRAEERIEKANRWGADLILSLHTDFNTEQGGYEDFVLDGLKTKQNFSFIHSMIRREVLTAGELTDRGTKTCLSRFKVAPTMPILKVNIGCIGWGRDEKKLLDAYWRHKVAAGFVKGLANAFSLRPNQTKKYRLILDGTQYGAYEKEQAVIQRLKHCLPAAETIIVEKIKKR